MGPIQISCQKARVGLFTRKSRVSGESRGYHRGEGTSTRLCLKPQTQGQSERLPPLDTFSWGPRAKGGASVFTADLTAPSSFLLLFHLSSSKFGFPLLHCWWEGKLVQALWRTVRRSSKDYTENHQMIQQSHAWVYIQTKLYVRKSHAPL